MANDTKIDDIVQQLAKIVTSLEAMRAADMGGAVCEGMGPDEGGIEALALAFAAEKPKIKEFIPARYYDKGRTKDIARIVIHYTTAGTASSTISEFTKKKGPNEVKTSSHYLVDKNGDIYQLVKDSDTAYHAKGGNADSIGIEHVARVGEKLEDAQSASSLALVSWLMSEYNVVADQVIPHKCVKNTSCCGDLFLDYGASITSDCKAQKKAIGKWLEAGGVS